jgi:PKD repeat protein
MRSCLLLLTTAMLVCLSGLSTLAATTQRVSVASDGTQANGSSYTYDACISADGRYVVFSSGADNLVPDDTNGSSDVFVHDRLTAQTERVSVATDGTEAAGRSWFPSISADGRYVAFASDAPNLVQNDTNGRDDVFVHDRLTGETTRVSVSSDGAEANGREDDGTMPSISADGRCVAFCSNATNLVPNDTNAEIDVFVHDRLTGETERVSVATDGTQAADDCWYPALSADGRYVVFSTEDEHLAPGGRRMEGNIYLRDRQTGTTVYVWDGFEPSISGDGRFVATGLVAVWVVDTQTWEAVRVDVASDGTPGNTGMGISNAPAMTPNGQRIAFMSCSSNLVPGDTNATWDVFVHDRQTGETERVGLASDGSQGNDGSSRPAISADGRYVSFGSRASNLVPNDTNDSRDVFVRARLITDFQAAPTVGRAPLSVVFTDLSVNPSSSWLWDFGDGGTSAEQNPTHVYEDSPGRYTVSLTSSGEWGSATETKPDYVTTRFFADVDLDHWACHEVEACVQAGVVTGYGPGYYHPDWPVTRDQMAVYVARALEVPSGEAALADWVPADPQNFPDVPSDHWAYTHIEYCVENGVVVGCDDGLYHPEYEVTRDQMAVYVARAMVAPSGEAGLADYVPADPRNFPDVASDFWSYKHVEYCVEHGVVQGYEDGLYHPEIVVTRDQMAVYVARAFGLLL